MTNKTILQSIKARPIVGTNVMAAANELPLYTDGYDVATVDQLFAQCFGEQRAVVIADSNTFAVAGESVYQRLEAAGRSAGAPFVFPGQPTL